jgi:hypothetical protein
MDALTIDRARLKLRLPSSQLGRRAVVEQIHEQVIREALEHVLAGESSRDELVCVRSIAVELRLDFREGDAVLGERWTAEFTRELDRILREGDPQRVVRYASPRAALVDMGRSLARRDLRRAWAWVQLGFIDASAALDLTLVRRGFEDTLLDQPELIVGVLAGLAREGQCFARVLRDHATEVWLRLSAAALRVHGITSADDLLAPGEPGRAEPSPAVAAGVEALAGLASRSSLAVSLVGLEPARTPGRVNAHRARALMLLAALDADPMVVRRVLGERPSALVEGATQQLLRSAAPASIAAKFTEPDGAATPTPASRVDPPLEIWRDELDGRARASSRWAGLLFTVALVRDEGLWPVLDELADRHGLEFRALVQCFGQTLIPDTVASDDPALLAFAGLPPDAAPPHPPVPERATILAEHLQAVRARLIAALDERVPSRPHRRQRGEALLSWLLRRGGVVFGEPGWLELHLDLREVDIDLRRAGLDLDPDWVPELGVVMRFVYA